MTTDPDRREYVRRNEDVVSHAQLAQEVKTVRKEITEHVHPEVGRIIDLLDGPCVEHLDGTVTRDEQQGMVKRQERIEVGQIELRGMLKNGVKVRQQLSGGDWVKLIGIIAAAVTAILAGGGA